MSDENPVAALASEDRELVIGAFEQGYFSVPSEVTVADLAAEFDLPEREVRRRLARGLATLLKTYRDATLQDLEGLLSGSELN